jgi:hypothetical protein
MGLCRQAAVGPVAAHNASAATATPNGANTGRICRCSTDASASAPAARNSSTMTDTIHVPGAESAASRPKPPAIDPVMAPAVFHA